MENKKTIFATLINDCDDLAGATILAKSLRKFGGKLSDSEIWFFLPSNLENSSLLEKISKSHQFSFEMNSKNPGYFFSNKILAWSQAEEKANNISDSLVWIDPVCLVVNEPSLFCVGLDVKAAFRPVHISNIGQSTNQEINGFWKTIYQQTAQPKIKDLIYSFIDEKRIYPYFNTHCFSINPGIGVLTKTKENLDLLSRNTEFMNTFCNDQLHKIFLFQAVLSATLLSLTSMEQILLLPRDYSYPFHLQEKIPPEKRINRLDAMTLMVYEEKEKLPLAFSQLECSTKYSDWYSSL